MVMRTVSGATSTTIAFCVCLPNRFEVAAFSNIGHTPECAHMERNEADMTPKWLLPVEDGNADTDAVDTRPADGTETCEALLKELESE